jgi:outer membrane biogenesis lipoprotein LolB
MAACAALLLGACSVRVEHVHENGPNTLATQERMQKQALEKLGEWQHEAYDRAQQAQKEAQHRCWQEGHRNCAWLGQPSYGGALSRGIWAAP